jgi:hypothetical protein
MVPVPDHLRRQVEEYVAGSPVRPTTCRSSPTAASSPHLADNEAGPLSTSPELARETYERLFRPDLTTDSRIEPAEGFYLVRNANPSVRASRWLRRMLVDLLWFI